MNALYTKAKQRFLTGSMDWLTDQFRVVLVDKTGYIANLTSDEYLISIPVEARTATSDVLTGKQAVNGVASADNIVIPSVTGQVDAIVIYKDTGSDATSPLLAFIDTSMGLPILLNNGDFNIQWNLGAARIFSL